ncbi:hypothetical protein GCM10010435_21600 [Winogradskya consettensis]|uniref:Lipoprotein n=1 Tax=Winogradskya consettensis TaxID=113560 RepID=A0A919VKS5_9ACTN|nr:hypothetical protein [Actinoplanes consettensis]GIM66711.1 hypothetical protein Aco04nite_03110 [Actinoplanes consettensis]
MRRALIAVTFGGLLLSGAACSSDGDTDSATEAPTIVTPSSAPASTTPPPDYSANTRAVCAKVTKIYNTELEDFGTEIGKMIAYKEKKQTKEADAAEKAAGKQLKDAGAQLKKETAAAQDPKIQDAGAASAAKLTASATDTKFFDKIKTEKDFEKTIEAQITEWMTPVTGFCAT